MVTIIPSPNNALFEPKVEDLNLITTPTEEIELLLIELGRTLIKEDSFTDWLTIPQIMKLCRNRRSQLTPHSFTTPRLEEVAESYFDRRHQILTEGLQVDYKLEQRESLSRRGLLDQIMLRFSRFRYVEPVQPPAKPKKTVLPLN
jgi:hypothetical protein